MFTITTIRERIGSAGGVFTAVQRQPNWVARLLFYLALLAGILLFLAILIPIVLFLFVVFLIGRIIGAIKSLFTRVQAPNGVLDGRRNVRVVQHDEP